MLSKSDTQVLKVSQAILMMMYLHLFENWGVQIYFSDSRRSY